MNRVLPVTVFQCVVIVWCALLAAVWALKGNQTFALINLAIATVNLGFAYRREHNNRSLTPASSRISQK